MSEASPSANSVTSDSEASPQSSISEKQQTAAKPQDLEASVQYRLRCLRMPLAVYREVAAHLRQVDGVETGLLPQTAQEFDYTKSQIGGLWISYQPGTGQASHKQTEEILAYYGDRFGAWEAIYAES